MVKTASAKAEALGSILDRGTKIPHGGDDGPTTKSQIVSIPPLSPLLHFDL